MLTFVVNSVVFVFQNSLSIRIFSLPQNQRVQHITTLPKVHISAPTLTQQIRHGRYIVASQEAYATPLDVLKLRAKKGQPAALLQVALSGILLIQHTSYLGREASDFSRNFDFCAQERIPPPISVFQKTVADLPYRERLYNYPLPM